MKILGRFLLLGVGCAVALAIAEAAVRWRVVADPIGEYLQVDGERDDPRARLLLLGDSFVDKRGGTFHRDLLEALADQRLAIANLAVSGTGPADYRDVLLQYGEHHRPDVVVLFYFAGNDLINVIRHAPRAPGEGLGRLRDWLRPLVHRLHLYHALTTRAGPPSFDYDAMRADGHDPELVERARTGEVNPWLLLIPREDRARYLGTNLLIESEASRAGAESLRAILREVDAEARALGARLVIVVFPATTQIDRSHFDFYERAGFDPDDRTLTDDAPQRLLAEIAASLDAPLLDLLPLFRAHAGEPLYRPYDSHLNERGNALAAEAVARFLVEEAGASAGQDARAD